MGKMKELSTVLDEIVTCGETLVQGAEKLRDMMGIIDSLAECGKTLISSGKALRDYFSDTEEAKPAAPGRMRFLLFWSFHWQRISTEVASRTTRVAFLVAVISSGSLVFIVTSASILTG